MVLVQRLVTTADVDARDPDDRHVSVTARHEAVLTDGRRIVLLDDRGWGESRSWATASLQDIADTTRVVVGPDEPFDGGTQEQMAADHWTHLARTLQEHGATVDAGQLSRLPHDVLLSQRLLARVGRDPGSAVR